MTASVDGVLLAPRLLESEGPMRSRQALRRQLELAAATMRAVGCKRVLAVAEVDRVDVPGLEVVSVPEDWADNHALAMFASLEVLDPPADAILIVDVNPHMAGPNDMTRVISATGTPAVATRAGVRCFPILLAREQWMSLASGGNSLEQWKASDTAQLIVVDERPSSRTIADDQAPGTSKPWPRSFAMWPGDSGWPV